MPAAANLPYWHRQDKAPGTDLTWNIPDQPSGRICLIGGHAKSFVTPIKIAEYLKSTFPLQSLEILLPDSLQKLLPASPDFKFTPSTPSGSIAEFPNTTTADLNLIIGDLSHNSATADALARSDLATPSRPTFVTRDAVDLFAEAAIAPTERHIIIASMAQLQKLFRALFYPKVLFLTQPLPQIIEALHKFTLSYPCTLLTFHEGQIIIAHNGKIESLPIGKTSFTPLTLWQGQLTAHAAGLLLYNPNQTTASLLTAATS